MRKTRLGRTGVEVSAIACGTWAHGGPKRMGKMEVGWSGHDDRQATDALVAAWESGITHWDTADVYGDGQAERLIGGLWGRLPREEIFLASKVGWDPGSYEHFYHPRLIDERIERSLRNLATDRIDLFYLHHCDFGPGDRFLDGAVERLRRARDSGKIRFIGLSDWSSEKVARYAPRVEPEVVQPYRNVIDDSYAASGLAAWVEQNDAGVAFFSPLRHGLLLGKYDQPTRFPDGDHRNRIPEFGDAAALARLRDCRAAVEQRFADRPEAVLHALTGVLLSDAPTGSVLLGMRRRSHAVAAAGLGEALSEDDADWVRGLYRGRGGS
jgi:aryl-alcohol dehydrogenase-like predicted oxidoreductase